MSKNLQISLAAARVNASLTQEAVAKELRVSKKTVINWEKGAASPSLAVMTALSDMYQIPIDNIILPLKST